MIRRWLEEIVQIQGVEGVYLASNKGQVIDKLGFEGNIKQLEKVSLYLLRIIAAFDMKAKNVTELEFYWHNRYIILKNSNKFILVTICKSPRVLAFLRITLNVVLANLLEDKKFNKWIRSHAADKALVLKNGVLDDVEKKMIAKLK